MEETDLPEGAIPVLDHGYVRYIEHWGSDERIVEAARMSTGKGFKGWGNEENPGDEKLLKHLWDNKHATPFEMAGATFEIQAPIMVFREWHRHRTQSYSEMSARYIQTPNLHYVPHVGRICLQSKTNKQASDMQAPLPRGDVDWFRAGIRKQQQEIYEFYEEAIERGISREVARLNTPVSRYSRMRASANLRNWFAFLTLRDDPAAQWEIRQYACEVSDILNVHFARSFELYKQGRLQPRIEHEELTRLLGLSPNASHQECITQIRTMLAAGMMKADG